MNQNILIIGTVFPEPNSTAAGSRILQIIDLFVKQNWTVNFASTAAIGAFSFDFKSSNVSVFNIKMNDSSFDDFIINLNPTLVIFDRFTVEEQFGWRVAQNCPNCFRVLDTIDLHFLRKARHENLKSGNELSDFDLLNSETAKREIASIYRCDLSLIISKFEMGLLLNLFKIDNKILYYLPFLLDKIDKTQLESFPTFAERQHFVSIGNFRHEPNLDAVLCLKNNIWKEIKKQIPDAEMHIYGSYIAEKAQQLHNKKEGFIIKGRAENAHEVIKNARVLLAPIRFGAGLKGKLIDAMQVGTPSVTTNIGAEGMRENGVWNGMVASDNQSFVNAAVALYNDENLWEKAQENGIELINNCFDKTIFEDGFINKISTTQSNLRQHRSENFIGQMLQHHTLQSTKYLSRWIEEKHSLDSRCQ